MFQVRDSIEELTSIGFTILERSRAWRPGVRYDIYLGSFRISAGVTTSTLSVLAQLSLQSKALSNINTANW